jgi:hypothetical protein
MLVLRRIAVLVALWLAFEAMISLFATCSEGSYQLSKAASYQQAKENCTAFSGPIFAIVRAFLYWLGHILEGYGEAVIAVFTIVLAFATGLLWKATRDLVHGAEDTAQRQLRAYVSVSPEGIYTAHQEERFVKIDCKVKNHGQTPAYEINHLFEIDVLANPLPTNFVYPAPTRIFANRATLHPQAEMTSWFNFNKLLRADEFEAVEQDKLRFHLWGTTRYRNAFGRPCHTDFRASVGGADFVAHLRAVRRGEKGQGFKWSWEVDHGKGDDAA